LEDLEREHILRVVARTPTLEDAVTILGIDASILWRKRKKIRGEIKQALVKLTKAL
jgi:NtrC-family two-component system response regulator AlgB